MAFEQIVYPRGAATTLDLKLHVGIGELNLRAATSGDNLIDGTVEVPDHFSLTHSLEWRGTHARIVVDLDAKAKLRRNAHRTPELLLRIAPDIPISLIVDNGIGQAELDLVGLQIANLAVKTNVGACEVRLPRAGVFAAQLQTGIGELQVSVPRGLAASIQAKRTIGDVDIDERFVPNGDRWVSEGFATAEQRVELNVTTRIGEVRVESIGWN